MLPFCKWPGRGIMSNIERGAQPRVYYYHCSRGLVWGMGHWHYTIAGPSPDGTASTRVTLTNVTSCKLPGGGIMHTALHWSMHYTAHCYTLQPLLHCTHCSTLQPVLHCTLLYTSLDTEGRKLMSAYHPLWTIQFTLHYIIQSRIHYNMNNITHDSRHSRLGRTVNLE